MALSDPFSGLFQKKKKEATEALENLFASKKEEQPVRKFNPKEFFEAAKKKVKEAKLFTQAGMKRIRQTPMSEFFFPTATPTKNLFVKGGQMLQRTPDVKMPEVPEAKVGGWSAPLFKAQEEKMELGKKVTDFALSLPSEIARSHGRFWERRGKGEKPNVEDILTFTDYLPGIGFVGVGGGVKAVTKKAGKELFEKAGKETIEKEIKKETPKIFSPARIEQMLDSVKSFLYSGEEEEAKNIFRKIHPSQRPAYQNLVNEVEKEQDILLSGTKEEVKQSLGKYGEIVNKFKNFLKFAGEKKSKETNLFREHIPQKVFGVSSDEIATSLGKTENEFMADLTKDLNIMSSGKGTSRIAVRLSRNVNKIRNLYEKLDPQYFKVQRDELGRPLSVSVEPTKETLAKIGKREAEGLERFAKQELTDWQKSYRETTQSVKQTVNKGLKAIKESTDQGVKNKLAKESGGIFLPSFRSPEYVFEKYGRKEDLWKPLFEGQEKVSKELSDYIPKANTWWKEVKGIKGSSENIFNYLDGKPASLSEKELKVANEIRDYLASWADKLGLPEEKRITNYITHTFSDDIKSKSIPEELERVLDYVTPSGEFNPYLETRLGAKGYKRDVFEALDAYIYRSAKKLHLDQPLNNAAEFAKKLPKQAADYTDKFLKNFKNRPDKFEKALQNEVIEPLFGEKLGKRPLSKLTRGLVNMVYRGVLGLNPAPALRNLTQFVNTFTELGTKDTATGYLKLLTQDSKELITENVLDDMLIAEYRNRGLRSALAKVDKGLFYMFELTEKINRGSAYFGAKAKFLREGLSERMAIDKAKELVRKTQFGYGKLHTPLALQSTLGKVGFQLSTFPIKQAELVGGWVKNKEVAKLTRYILSSLAVVYASKNYMDDILGMKYTDLFFKNILPTLGPIPGLASEGADYLSAPEGDKEYLKTKLEKRLFSTFVPAGSQIRKTYEGAKAYEKGGSFTPSGKLRFSVKQTPEEQMRTLLFGTSSLPQAKEYYKDIGYFDKDYLEELFKPEEIDVEEIHSQIMKESKEKRSGKYKELIKDLPDEKVEELKRISKLESLGLTKEDRKLFTVDESKRAPLIHERIMRLKAENRKAKYKELKKVGLITPLVDEEIKALIKESEFEETNPGLIQGTEPETNIFQNLFGEKQNNQGDWFQGLFR